ncbi:MAG: hypothetical protein ACKV1O_08370, partial [Saprospiraceae bacterium]
MNVRYLWAFRLLKQFTATLIICITSLSVVQAQELLFSEDFNGCALPDGWVADLSGYPDADWYVGTPQNPASDGSTI